MITYFQFRNALFIVLLKYSPLAQAACARWTMQESGTYWILLAEQRTAFAAPLAKESAPAIPATRWQSWHWYNCMRSPARRTICKQPTFFYPHAGPRPLFFDRERGVDTDGSDYIYNQAHCPLTAQTTAVGHAVRGVYLYAGAAAVAEHTGTGRCKPPAKRCGKICVAPNCM